MGELISIRSAILHDLKRAIESDASVFNWKNAFMQVRPLAELAEYPACNLVGILPEQYVAGAVDCLTARWPVRIDAAHKVVEETGYDAQTVADQILADLRRIVLADPQRDGLAIDTRPVSGKAVATVAIAPLVTASLTIEITYRTAFDDPFMRR